ncbi:MAG: hypothetical protein WAT19_09220 [Ferruginibacter sp.]
MYYLLFIFYFALFYFCISRSSFIKKTGLNKKEIAALFTLKIAAGILLGFVVNRLYPGINDYWGLNAEAKREYQLLMHSPGEFIKSIFQSGYNEYGGFFGSFNSHWNDLRIILPIKLVAIFNIFSRGNYYINSLFLNSIVFFGHAALFLVFTDVFKGKKWLVLTGCFLLPSTLYFTSGLGKDAVVFLGLALFSYAIYFLRSSGVHLKKMLLLLASLLMVLLIRNFVAMLLLPATFALLLSYRLKIKPLYLFLAVYVSSALLLTALQYASPQKNPLHIIASKQKAFFEIEPGRANIATDSVEPRIQSILKNSPQALNHVLMRPYVTESKNWMYAGIAAELVAYQILFLLTLIFFERPAAPARPFVNFSIFLSLSLFIFIGLIVPNIGAIFRYRSVYLPWLIIPILCSINWRKISINSH